MTVLKFGRGIISVTSTDSTTPTVSPQLPIDTSETRKIIEFPNGNTAYAIEASIDGDPEAIWNDLRLPTPNSLIVLSGAASGLDKSLEPRLTQLFSRGIARAAKNLNATLISGGTDDGTMALLGQSIHERSKECTLIGIAPNKLTTYPDSSNGKLPEEKTHLVSLEPHHSHFVLVDSDEWGGETQVMYGLVSFLAKKKVPTVTILVNGGGLCRKEILSNVRSGIPIIIIEGSGRLADEIAQLYREKPDFIEDPELAEIIADGNLHLFPIEGSVDELKKLVERQISGDHVLKLAWQQFSTYDLNAKRQQRSFLSLQIFILLLGIIGTTLALLQTSFEQYLDKTEIEELQTKLQQPSFEQSTLGKSIDNAVANSQFLAMIIAVWKSFQEWLAPYMQSLIDMLGYLIICIPILVSVLLAATNRFKPGNKWILLRASAEGVKREIFRYRVRAEDYSSQKTTAEETAEVKLAKKLQTIGHQLMQTEANMMALHAYKNSIPPQLSRNDDGMSTLSADRYVFTRLEDQMNYYLRKTRKLERNLMLLQWATYLIGGLGTLLAALGLELWIALTTAIATSIATYLEYRQVENTLQKYNQAAIDLANVRSWWIALSTAEQARQSNIDLLVGHTERILQSEFTGWVEEMTEALNSLREQQAEAERQSSRDKQKNNTKEQKLQTAQ